MRWSGHGWKAPPRDIAHLQENCCPSFLADLDLRVLVMTKGSDGIEDMAKETLKNVIIREVQEGEQKAKLLAVTASVQSVPPSSEKQRKWWRFWR